jgi:hypothetical protein
LNASRPLAYDVNVLHNRQKFVEKKKVPKKKKKKSTLFLLRPSSCNVDVQLRLMYFNGYSYSSYWRRLVRGGEELYVVFNCLELTGDARQSAGREENELQHKSIDNSG